MARIARCIVPDLLHQLGIEVSVTVMGLEMGAIRRMARTADGGSPWPPRSPTQSQGRRRSKRPTELLLHIQSDSIVA